MMREPSEAEHEALGVMNMILVLISKIRDICRSKVEEMQDFFSVRTCLRPRQGGHDGSPLMPRLFYTSPNRLTPVRFDRTIANYNDHGKGALKRESVSCFKFEFQNSNSTVANRMGRQEGQLLQCPSSHTHAPVRKYTKNGFELQLVQWHIKVFKHFQKL